MLEIIIGFFVFCIILFFYLHIHFHLKTSNDLEIYEIEQASKDKMEEICDLRQPVLFDCDEDTEKITRTTSQSYLLDNYPIFEVKIRESNVSEAKDDENMFLPLPLHVATKLFQDDKSATYFSEGNTEFLAETGAQKNMSYNDEFLRPFLVSNCNYDILMGSDGVTTPLRYEINYRNYFLVTQGSLKVKLAPPYWWYSFKFAENTSVSSFKYRTYMNNIAISPHIFMYALQNQNVERKTAKQIDIKTLNQESKETTNISELNTKSDTTVSGEEIVEIPDIKNEVNHSIENIVTDINIDVNNQFVSSI
jgi:hypothetical protein